MLKIYIVGAHSRAQTVAEYIRCLYPDVRVEAYLYDNEEPNPGSIGKRPVIRLDGKVDLNPVYPVCIGTRGVYHERLAASLKKMGFEKVYPVTPEMDTRLRNAYVRKHYADKGRRFLKLEELDAVQKSTQADMKKRIYIARSVFDKALESEYETEPYEKELQAGAALTMERLSSDILTDDVGDNISVKNKQYCELTALYWLWKHADEDVLGLVHYRRHFILPKDWFMRMREHKVDVVLPVPLYVAPSLADNFKKRHDPAVWETMMGCLQERDMAESREAEVIFRKNLYSPCNMFIMRKEALDDLCTWMFPVLFQTERRVGKKTDDYQNRYPGFLSERLISFFFEKNRKKYKVVYADKNFLR